MKDSLKVFTFPAREKTFSPLDQTQPCHQLAPPCNNQAPVPRDFLPSIRRWERLYRALTHTKPILALSSSTPPRRWQGRVLTWQKMFLIRAERTVGKNHSYGFLFASLTPIKIEEDEKTTHKDYFIYCNCCYCCFEDYIDLYRALEERRHLSCLCQRPHKVSLDIFLATSTLLLSLLVS